MAGGRVNLLTYNNVTVIRHVYSIGVRLYITFFPNVPCYNPRRLERIRKYRWSWVGWQFSFGSRVVCCVTTLLQLDFTLEMNGSETSGIDWWFWIVVYNYCAALLCAQNWKFCPCIIKFGIKSLISVKSGNNQFNLSLNPESISIQLQYDNESNQIIKSGKTRLKDIF